MSNKNKMFVAQIKATRINSYCLSFDILTELDKIKIVEEGGSTRYIDAIPSTNTVSKFFVSTKPTQTAKFEKKQSSETYSAIAQYSDDKNLDQHIGVVGKSVVYTVAFYLNELQEQ